MASTLHVTLQQHLFLANTVFVITNPIIKPVLDVFAPFIPRLSEEAANHLFLAAHGNAAVPILPLQTNFHLSSKASVKAACDSHLVRWIIPCLQTVGRPRQINVLRESGSIPRVLQSHRGFLPDIQVDFAFIYGQSVEEERVAAVLQTKSVGSLNPCFWRGETRATLLDKMMTQEARAYAYLFNTPVVLLFDGKTLIRVYFAANPLFTDPLVSVTEHGKEYPHSMRRVIFLAICNGMDMKKPGWV